MTILSEQNKVGTLSRDALAFQNVVRARHSVRSFLDTPVSDSQLREVLMDAQHAPSNCNTQPWQTHVVSGAKLKQLSKLLLEKDAEGAHTPDFSFDQSDYFGDYDKRNKAFGKTYYTAMGVDRDDKEKRARISAQNYSFFNAPHAAFLFMPSFGDDVRAAGDLGMYGQTLLLSLTAHGLGGIPQTSLGFFADTLRAFLDVPASLKLLFGISLGYPDTSAAANSFRTERAPLAETVRFHG